MQSFLNVCGGQRTSCVDLFLFFFGVGPGVEFKSPGSASRVFIHLAEPSISSLKDAVVQLVSVLVYFAIAPQAQDFVLGRCRVYQYSDTQAGS